MKTLHEYYQFLTKKEKHDSIERQVQRIANLQNHDNTRYTYGKNVQSDFDVVSYMYFATGKKRYLKLMDRIKNNNMDIEE